MVSKKLIDAVRLNDRKLYLIAHDAGMHPSLLSNIINLAINLKDGDDRVIRIGEVVGISAKDCFE